MQADKPEISGAMWTCHFKERGFASVQWKVLTADKVKCAVFGASFHNLGEIPVSVITVTLKQILFVKKLGGIVIHLITFVTDFGAQQTPHPSLGVTGAQTCKVGFLHVPCTFPYLSHLDANCYFPINLAQAVVLCGTWSLWFIVLKFLNEGGSRCAKKLFLDFFNDFLFRKRKLNQIIAPAEYLCLLCSVSGGEL